ncbi:Sjogren's syndrome/scleroderma autoantigen 1 family protein [Haloarcula nitratireducens]|uniref:Sjogrens syndrome scleroderma autoantigen 1 n=1 Tax=Haloarcula nitratireducens TaxID=2487749 RepID=A0AAW4PDY8_9EURY|nr:Sjogren's syndrome/scleroderma autoantigen 1 family protein [Halomicroarcula nitratireducens]MBX0295942.1 hypothetical protein [Halomicroarcula nitratireducens]
MSDFDKEAEREKLREKFEAEEEKREATEQMSELLLKGATMTNAHCSDCGDPVFRYDGQEFCPTCQKPISREQRQGETADGEDAEDAEGDTTPTDAESAETRPDDEESGDHIEVADPSEDARVQFGAGDGESESDDVATAGETNDGRTADDQQAARSSDERRANDRDAAEEPPQSAEEPAAGQSARAGGEPRGIPSADPDRTPVEGEGQQPTTTDETGRPGAERGETGTRRNEGHRRPSVDDRPTPSVSTRTTARSGGSSGDVATDLAEAETLLAETVRRFAERAATTENPREAKDHLAAAREAAEALDATRR